MLYRDTEIVKNPIVSVMMRAYNNEKYIKEAVDSVLSQKTDYPYEIIIGDDYSSDNTLSIALEYQKLNPQKIVVIHNEKNLRVAANTNEILKHCRGSYIAICDCDDFWQDEDKIQKQIEFMEHNVDVVATYHDEILVDEKGVCINDSFIPIERKRNFSQDELRQGYWILTTTLCFRSIANQDIITHMTNKVYNEDTFIISLLGNYGRGVYMQTIKPSAYRQQQSGVWSMQNSARRTLMILSTTGELMLYYRKKGNKQFFRYYQNRMLTNFASVLSTILSKDDKKFYKTLLNQYWPYIGLRNLLYYRRYI